jgi:hypothetical protein
MIMPASAFMINRQMASYCMPSWTEDHPEAGYLCSGFDSLSPVLIILVACSECNIPSVSPVAYACVAFLYAGILSFVTYTHTDRVPKSCGSCILTADLYNIPWFSNNTITTTTHNSNNKNISTFPTNLEKRNIHGLVISKPWAPTSPNPDLEAAHCATSYFDDRRSRAASGIWSDWDDVDLGQPTRAHAYNIQHGYAASMIERSTTYSGKIPQTGYETDRRATWARRLAASVVRGRSNPFPAVPHQQDVAGLQSPAPVLASPHAHRKSLSTQVYSLTLGEGISVSGPKDVLAHSGLGLYRHDSDATAYEHELARPGAPLPGDQAKALPPIPAFRVENRTSREPSWFSDDPSTRWSRSSFPRSDFGHGFGRDVELGLGNTQEAKAEWLAVSRFSGHSDKSEKSGKLSWMGHISKSSKGSMSSLGKSLQRTEGGLWVSLNSK